MKFFEILSILSTMVATSCHAWISLSETTCHEVMFLDGAALVEMCSYYEMYGPSYAWDDEKKEAILQGGYGHTTYYLPGDFIQDEIAIQVTWDDIESTACEATINGAVCTTCMRCPETAYDAVTLDCYNVQDTVNYDWIGGTQYCQSLEAIGASPPLEFAPLIIVDDPTEVPTMNLPCFETRDLLKQVVDAYLAEDSDGFFNGWYMGPIGDWCVDLVPDFSYLFDGYETFNEPLNNWVMSSAVTTEGMFRGAKSFNQDISSWDMSKVESMRSMFEHAESFNQNIDDWNVENVSNMNRMFAYAKKFNQDLDSWDTSNVSTMRMMFLDAIMFNGDIGSWQVDSVESMNRAFMGCENFNRDLSSWDVSEVNDFRAMFYGASSFNQNLCEWGLDTVGATVKVSNMFEATSCADANEPQWFGQGLPSGSWCQACTV